MSNFTIKQLNAADADFHQQLQNLLAWDETDDLDIQQRVLAIIADVRKNGDKAVIDYTNRFDRRNINQAGELELSKETLKSAWEKLPVDQAQALQTAADRIRAYAEHQKMQSWQYTEADGTVLGQKITPLDRVGFMCRAEKRPIPLRY